MQYIHYMLVMYAATETETGNSIILMVLSKTEELQRLSEQ